MSSGLADGDDEGGAEVDVDERPPGYRDGFRARAVSMARGGGALGETLGLALGDALGGIDGGAASLPR